MVTITGHGGNCCGARHIHGFGTNDRLENIAEMHNHAASAPDRLTEIILNRTQCQSSPRLLAAMAERGYVLTTGFKNGNHNSDVFVFHRSDRRLRLDNVNRDFGFEWNGQLASPTLHGNLDALVATNRSNTPDTGLIPEHHSRPGRPFHLGLRSYYPTDMTLRYVGPSIQRQGQVFALRHGYTNWSHACGYMPSGAESLKVQETTTGELVELSRSSFAIDVFTAAAPQPAPPPPPLGNQRYVEVGAAPAAVEEERIVYTTFHNVYRDGRIGAGYPTSQEARNASPRALNRLTRHIYNTGRVEDVVG